MAGEPRCRPFNLVDTMILLAAIACGLALSLRSETAALVWELLVQRFTAGAPRRMADPTVLVVRTTGVGLVMLGLVVLEEFFLPWLAAFLVIRLRKPRPALREVVRQPGTAAVVILAAWFLGSLVLTPTVGTFPLLMFLVAASVPVAWTALALTGNWSAEPGWIDGLGRALGVFFSLAIAGQFVAISLP